MRGLALTEASGYLTASGVFTQRRCAQRRKLARDERVLSRPPVETSPEQRPAGAGQRPTLEEPEAERETTHAVAGRPFGAAATRATVVSLVIAAIAALSLLWLAAETHYRACVEAVATSNPASSDSFTRLARTAGVNECSRLP